MRKLSLLIDADDTLWENNIFFEAAFAEFVELLDHSRMTAEEIQAVLDEIEIKSIQTDGYGCRNFGRNMQRCFRLLAERPWTQQDSRDVMAIAERILDEPIRLFDGVEATLARLAGRHKLTLYSKGHFEEQHAKIERSGLRQYFTDCVVVEEKNAAGYRYFVEENGLERGHTWMIGNSPKSDINPALRAGLGAVLVPHPRTWSLEREDVPEPSERFHVIDRFSDLKGLF